jgi:ATP sulfurylase
MAHEFLQFAAMEKAGCDGIFVHPVTGPKKVGDFSGDIILKTYELLIDEFYPANRALLGGFLTYSRYAGPREAVFTALCRQNFGCSHFIVGRDHTGVGDYYSRDASQRLFSEIGDIDIGPLFFDEIYYCRRCHTHVEQCNHGRKYSETISGTQVRQVFNRGEVPPDWFMRNQVSQLILEELNGGGEVFAT